MIKPFEEFITEAKQVGILYHYTSIDKLIAILRENRMLGGRIVRTGAMGVSFTRDRHFHMKPWSVVSMECRLVVDGDLLSNRYGISPYQYDRYLWKGDPNRDQTFVESEERVLTDEIKEILGYVISVEFPAAADEWILTRQAEAQTMLDSLGIPHGNFLGRKLIG